MVWSGTVEGMRTVIVTMLTLGAMAMAMAGTGTAHADGLSAEDRLEITEAVTGVGLFTDLRDWDRVATVLADEVTTDYVSVFGGEPATAPRDELIGQWRVTLQGFDATQHLITNVAVDGSGDTATSLSHVRASHWIDGAHWTVGGTYTHQLFRGPTGWQVNYMKIQHLYEEGDRSVFEAAAQR